MGDRYSIVEGDPREHRSDVIALLARNFENVPDPEARYATYYEGNPGGPPRFHLARDEESGGFVGLAALFPARLRVLGEPVAAAISADFAVDDGHRGFGPALALQRAALAGLQAAGITCAFGCPNAFSDPIIARVGFADAGALTRYVKVLRSGHVLERRGSLARAASRVSSFAADPAVALLSRARLRRRSSGFTVERTARFDERFAGVFDATHAQHEICAERSAAALNWKYGGGHDVLSLLDGEGGAAAGYVVSRSAGGVRDVLDIAHLSSQAALDALLAELVLDARRAREGAITLYHRGAPSLLTRRLRAFGFMRRPERKRLRVYVRPGAERAAGLLDGDRWHFLFGDTDV